MPSVPTMNLSCRENRPLHSKLLLMPPFWSFFVLDMAMADFFSDRWIPPLMCQTSSLSRIGLDAGDYCTSTLDLEVNVWKRICDWQWLTFDSSGLSLGRLMQHGILQFFMIRWQAPTPLLHQIWPRKVLHCRQRSGCLSPKQISY